MTKEEIFNAFISDELLTEKKYLTSEQISSLKFVNQAPNKLIEVLKIIINEKEGDDPSDLIILRKINNHLNK
jgi:hypothetical protein